MLPRVGPSGSVDALNQLQLSAAMA